MRANKFLSLLAQFSKSGYKSPWLSYPALYGVGILMEVIYAFLFCKIYSEHMVWCDSNSYIAAIETIFAGQLDLFRTPIYPIIIGVLRVIFGARYILATIMLQLGIFFISSILFQRIITKFVSSKVAFWIVAYYLLGIGFNQYNYYILTESLSLSGIVAFLYFLLRRYPQKVSAYDVLMATLTLGLLIYLRPVFIYLLPVATVYFLCLYGIHNISLKVLNIGLCGLAVISVSVVIYTNVMHSMYGINSLSIVNTYNNYFMLRQESLPHIKYTDNANLKKVIREINNSSTTNPERSQIWEEISVFSRAFNEGTITPGDYEEFVYNSLRANKVNCLKVLKSRLFAEDTVFPILFEYDFLSSAHMRIYPSFFVSILVYFMLFMFWILQYRHNKQISVVYLLLCMIVGGLWFSSFIGAYGDYHRLCLPSMPAFLIMIGMITNVIGLKFSPISKVYYC